MRSHGVPAWPDPAANQANIKFPPGQAQQFGVSSSRFNAAKTACQHLLPVTRMSQAQDQQALSKFLRFARCMHSHGVPGWPDPTRAPGQIPPFTFNIQNVQGVQPRSWSPQINTAVHECQRLIHSQVSWNQGAPS
jgi:hypothetical protein